MNFIFYTHLLHFCSMKYSAINKNVLCITSRKKWNTKNSIISKKQVQNIFREKRCMINNRVRLPKNPPRSTKMARKALTFCRIGLPFLCFFFIPNKLITILSDTNPDNFTLRLIHQAKSHRVLSVSEKLNWTKRRADETSCDQHKSAHRLKLKFFFKCNHAVFQRIRINLVMSKTIIWGTLRAQRFYYHRYCWKNKKGTNIFKDSRGRTKTTQKRIQSSFKIYSLTKIIKYLKIDSLWMLFRS